MRDYDSISEIEMDNKTYAVLVNQKDNEDMLCLRATLDGKLKLEKLDESEFIKVLECICNKNGINAE